MLSPPHRSSLRWPIIHGKITAEPKDDSLQPQALSTQPSLRSLSTGFDSDTSSVEKAFSKLLLPFGKNAHRVHKKKG